MIADFIKRQMHVNFRRVADEFARTMAGEITSGHKYSALPELGFEGREIVKDIADAKKKIEEYSLRPHDILPEKGRGSFKCPVCCGREKGITFDIKYVADDLMIEIIRSIQADYKLSERIWIIRFKCLNCDTEWEDAYRIGCIDRKVTYVSTMPELDADSGIDIINRDCADGIIFGIKSGIKDEHYKKLSIETDLK